MIFYLRRWKKIMNEEIFEYAKENDLSLDEAEELQEAVDEAGIDPADVGELKEIMDDTGLDADDASLLL